MLNPRLASRYAKSLIDLAIERGQLEAVYADMLWLKSACKSSREFVNLLRSPIIKGETKQKIVQAVVGGKIGELSNAFIRLLINKVRESYLPEITDAAIGLYKQHHKIQTVQLTTATPASESLKSALVEQLKKSVGFAKVELEEKVDPSLIGGFVLQVGDRLVDASIAYDLKAIAKQFENNDFIYRIR